MLQNTSSYTAQKFFSNVAAVFPNPNAKNSREGGGFYILQCLLCSADTDLPTDRQTAGLETRSIVQSSINTRYCFCYRWDHQLMPVYTQLTCDLSLNGDSHTGFFRATAVGLCPPTCNERSTRVLHLLPLRSYACVLIVALFCVVFHPTRAVHNLDLRFVSNGTYVECDTRCDGRQIPKFLTRTYGGFQGQSCSCQSSAVDTDSCKVYLV